MGESQSATILYPAFTLDWNVGGYGSSRKTAIRVVNSTDITIDNVTLLKTTVLSGSLTGILDKGEYEVIGNLYVENNDTLVIFGRAYAQIFIQTKNKWPNI